MGMLLCLMLIASFVFVTRPSIHGNDGVQNYSYLRSLRFDKNLDFSNEYDYYMSREADWFDKKLIPRDPVTDLPINLYGVGSSILWAPWVLWADGILYAAERAGKSLPYQRDGYSLPYQLAVGFASSFYASLGLWLLFLTLRRMRSESEASWAIIPIWLASPLFFYMYLHPSMSHANSFFLAALLFTLYVSNSEGKGRWFLLGLIAGLLTITRFQDGILLLSLVVGEVWNFWSTPSGKGRWLIKRFGYYLLWILAFSIAVTPQLFAWHQLQGSWYSGPRAYLDQGSFSLLRPDHVAEVLFSGRHGLFYWHPALVLAIAGLLVAGQFLREKLMALSVFAGQTWVVASWSIWWAGASFGHRMFISVLPFLAVGAMVTIGRKGFVGFVLKSLVVLLVIWNFGCVIQYGYGWVSRQQAVSYKELARNNFVKFPSFVLEKLNVNQVQKPNIESEGN